MQEHFFQCPYCGETISMLLDSSLSTQEYIEDCEVCCNPILIHVDFSSRQLIAFEAHRLDQ